MDPNIDTEHLDQSVTSDTLNVDSPTVMEDQDQELSDTRLGCHEKRLQNVYKIAENNIDNVDDD